MTKKKTETKFEYAKPDSVLTLDGKEYRLGDPCDGWTPEQVSKYSHSILPLGTLEARKKAAEK